MTPEQQADTIVPKHFALRHADADDIRTSIAMAIRTAVIEERNACAALCEATQSNIGSELAEGIRARNRIRGSRA